MLERHYQADLIYELRRRFPGCFILKNDTDYRQGIPDLLVLYKNKWEQPNQAYYIELFNGMSFAAFIYPENETEVLDELQQAFKSRRSTRLSLR
jgi:hypothetical protein